MEIARAIYICYSCANVGALSEAWKSGLFGAYPFFTALLFSNVLQWAILFPFAPSSIQYYHLYSSTAWVILAFQVATACEAWTISTHLQYPRIGNMANWLACCAVIVGVAAAFMTGLVGFDILSLEHVARLQTWHLITVRYASTALFCTSALAWTLNTWISEGVRPNARKHAGLLSGIFGSQAIGFLILSNYRPMAPYIGFLSTGCIGAFIGLWAFLMTPDGESRVFQRRLGDVSVLEHLPALTKRVVSASN